MSTIDPRASVLAALQARLAPLARSRSAAAGRVVKGASAQVAAPALAQRIAAIDRSDPDRRRKAVRVVLEAELARTFGAGLLNDPGFPGLLDAVQARMQEEAQVAAAVEALGDLLLAGPP